MAALRCRVSVAGIAAKLISPAVSACVVGGSDFAKDTLDVRRALHLTAQRRGKSMISNVLDAVATSEPEASVTVPSMNAVREPDLTTWPVAVSAPLEGRTAFRKLTLIS